MIISSGPQSSQPAWLPLPVVARRLRTSFGTVVWLLHHGYLVGHLVRPHWFIRADSLQRYIRWRKRASERRAA